MAGTDTFEDMCRSRRTTAVLVALALASAACSGSNASDPVVTPAPPAAAGDTEPPPVTEAPTTTTTPTTTSTTVAPTTTIDETAALIAEIEADLNEGEEAFLTAAGDPSNPQSKVLLAQHFALASLQVLEEFLEQLVANDTIARPGRETQSVVKVLAILASTSGSATVTTCRIDAGVVVVPSSTPGAPEIIVNDEILRYGNQVELQFVDGVWKPTANTVLSTETGVTSCDA
jgi:hypothetical protein